VLVAKTIFIFNDGTGQSSVSDRPSNVLKLFNSLPGQIAASANSDIYKVDNELGYHAIYIRGIGTKDLRPAPDSTVEKTFWEKLMGRIKEGADKTSELVTGSSIADRVERTISEFDRLWEKGDRVILVGFSRGASSVRIAASYLAERDPSVVIDYMLIFDTVYSVLGEVQIRDSKKIKRFEDTEIGSAVLKCDHLIAGDEMRDMFPVTPVQPRIGVRQILFAGSHSDVGGGNPSSSLSDIALNFSIRQLTDVGILFDPARVDALKMSPNPAAKIEWDRFNGTGQTHFPRDFALLSFVIHRSVFERANAKESISIALAQLSTFSASSSAELIATGEVDASFDLS
jgi:uncharacterized protein (DUF2235 family)